MSYGIGAYKNTSVKTASKEQILLMLYQAAIKNCKKGIEAIKKNDIQKKGEHIGQMQDIIVELTNSLDHNIGGEITKELNSLYDFILHESTQANIHLDSKKLEGCHNILTTLYEGWTKAVKHIKDNPADEK